MTPSPVNRDRSLHTPNNAPSARSHPLRSNYSGTSQTYLQHIESNRAVIENGKEARVGSMAGYNSGPSGTRLSPAILVLSAGDVTAQLGRRGKVGKAANAEESKRKRQKRRENKMKC